MGVEMMSHDEAIAIVSALFKWIYDSPIPYPADEQRMRLSTIANIVIDSCHGDIRNQPLHDAYAEVKRDRGIS